MVEEPLVVKEPFSALVGRYREAVLAYLERRIPAHLTRSISAEDLLQDALLAMHKQMKSGTLSGEHAYHTLYQFARHALINAIRTNRRVKRGGGTNRVAGPPDFNPLVLIPSTGGTPSSFFAHDERRQRIRTAVFNMPTKYGRILVMRYLDRMKRCDIARALGIPISRVSNILFRARDHFRAAYGLESSVA